MIAFIRRLFKPKQPQERIEWVRVNCPCCGYLSLDRKKQWPDLCQWSICPICFWEDDDEFTGGGANRGIDIAQARSNFAQYRAMSPDYVKFVRRPTKTEAEGYVLPPDAQQLIGETLQRYEKAGGSLLKFYCEG